ncbi:alanine racemase [Aliifodinibius sp. S!AR15-10]|uniref:alanine racemase n=1 Tax=Aliifodinibius sp. S!AR15-10 TaxID=2950437 RepID=UPI0028568F57|nr:alanine racemase [Aliifodinibius sp. S!AR15-10]MDR8391710.1 alanine racemase [Aliifodinibius sp. S!AR15-10]
MHRHSSRIELSEAALKNNLDFIRSNIGGDTIISSVVKANAYGHGIHDFVPLAEECGIRHFAVASSYEAEEVVEARTTDADVMIMGILYPEDLPWVIKHEIEYFVYDFHRLERSVDIAKQVGKKARIHLELETGGNRTGLEPEKLDQTIAFIKKNLDYLELEGVCTHYAGIESLSNQFRIQQQEQLFEQMYERITDAGIEPNLRHTACSAGALAFPETVMDMVRVGTAQYGLWPSPDIYNLHLMQEKDNAEHTLEQVLSWKTNIMHLKDVAEGQYIGYGTAFQASRDMRVAVIPIGYGNGYARSLSNNGEVLIHGQKTPIVGSVNMNVFMVDVTDLDGVNIRDKVVLIGQQNGESISIKSFTEGNYAINNEFISRLPAAIPRKVVS